MSLHEYLCSQAISAGDPPFYALLFAMIRKADSENASKICRCWPEKFREMQRRYNAPGGIIALGEELPEDLIVKASGASVWRCSTCGHENGLGLSECEECITKRGIDLDQDWI